MLFAEKDGLIKKVTLCKPDSNELSVQSRLPLSGSHIVIPTDLQKAILEKLHTEHLGITKCQERVKQCVWWPRIGKHVEEEVQKCLVCSQFCHQNVEPLFPTNFPDYPWQKVAADLFTWKDTNSLILADYYSHCIKMSNWVLQFHLQWYNTLNQCWRGMEYQKSLWQWPLIVINGLYPVCFGLWPSLPHEALLSHTYITRSIQAKPSITFQNTPERTVILVKATEKLQQTSQVTPIESFTNWQSS